MAPYSRLRVDEFKRLCEAGAVLHLKCLELLAEAWGDEESAEFCNALTALGSKIGLETLDWVYPCQRKGVCDY